MLFFLGSWRNAVVVMIAIPTSLGVTLFVMKMMNLTLDTVSLMAMTLVIGILIDDSTVVLENIERHRTTGRGAGRRRAQRPQRDRHGRDRASRLVDVVVFLPIAFAGGQVGQLLAEFAIVITVATLTSLFVSFTITPTLAGLWSMRVALAPVARRSAGSTTASTALRTRYAERWLPAALRPPVADRDRRRRRVRAGVLLIPTGLVGEEFMPPQDQGIIDGAGDLPGRAIRSRRPKPR